MARLIDADAIKYRTLSYGGWGGPPEEIADKYLIDKMPTVDAVEVVRCKGCEHGIWDEYEELWKCVEAADYDEEYGVWGGFVSYNKAEHYCSYGERRTDG